MVLLGATALLFMHHYLVTNGWVSYTLVTQLHVWLRPLPFEASEWVHSRPDLISNLGWALASIMIWGVLPAIALRSTYGIPFSDLGWGKPQNTPWQVLGGCTIGLLVFILVVKDLPDFRATYPFFKSDVIWPDWVVFEYVYLGQFIALEFFFRGAMLHLLERQIGETSVWITTLPYVMIHFQKPWLETIGAVFAGVGLAYLSLRTRSIWPGVLLHVTVALAMDFISLLS